MTTATLKYLSILLLSYPVAYDRYRITKRVKASGRHYLLTAEFIVAPYVPFPRFSATTTDTPVR